MIRSLLRAAFLLLIVLAVTGTARGAHATSSPVDSVDCISAKQENLHHCTAKESARHSVHCDAAFVTFGRSASDFWRPKILKTVITACLPHDGHIVPPHTPPPRLILS